MAARDDLLAELPDLLATFEPGFGAIDRTVYNLGEWSTAPRAFNTGCRHRPHCTVGLLGSGGRTIALLIVLPCTDRGLARAAMSAAADPKATATVADLMAMTVGPAPDRAIGVLPSMGTGAEISQSPRARRTGPPCPRRATPSNGPVRAPKARGQGLRPFR
ncbi:DUF5994 family protein [Nocardia nova]|uniref:DUF5994 family protein n=1 Tax=Nocardia nova TaxID=37330 RepID=UPI0034D3CA44